MQYRLNPWRTVPRLSQDGYNGGRLGGEYSGELASLAGHYYQKTVLQLCSRSIDTSWASLKGVLNCSGLTLLYSVMYPGLCPICSAVPFVRYMI